MDARVVAEHRGRYQVQLPDGSVRFATLTGRLRAQIDRGEAPHPVVGDVVLAGDSGGAQIAGVRERRTQLSRRRPGTDGDSQVLAANVDVVCFVIPVEPAPNL